MSGAKQDFKRVALVPIAILGLGIIAVYFLWLTRPQAATSAVFDAAQTENRWFWQDHSSRTERETESAWKSSKSIGPTVF